MVNLVYESLQSGRNFSASPLSIRCPVAG